jgi:hypothetical protein
MVPDRAPIAAGNSPESIRSCLIAAEVAASREPHCYDYATLSYCHPGLPPMNPEPTRHSPDGVRLCLFQKRALTRIGTIFNG